MSESFYEKWEKLVTRVARAISYDYPDVEAEDLAQGLYLRILELGWTNPDDESVVPMLRKFAKNQAAKDRAEHLILSPQYSYQTSDVRRILRNVFGDWIKSPSFTHSDDDGQALPTRDAHSADYDSILVEYSDVKRAWELTPKHYRKIIFEKYALGYEFDDAGERRLRRAVARLCDYLNTYQPRSSHVGPGSQRVIRNAQAQYLIRKDYSASDDVPGRFDRDL